MKAVKFSLLALALALAFTACGGKPKSKITFEDAKGPGRDAELMRDGFDAIRKGNFDQGRILLNTMINTYTDSPMIKMAKLAIADSYYLQGGSKSLAQAEVEYRDWIQFFPDDALAAETMMKMAEIHLKQVQAPDRDITQAKLAERQLKEMMRRYPTSEKKERTEQLMNEVQEVLAMHELKVAHFYFDIRESATACQLRTEEILSKYPNFSRFDEALWYHARALELQEDTETASRDLTRLASNYPKSEFAERAIETLKKWGKPVPEVDPAKLTEPGPEGKSMPARFAGLLFGPHIDTSDKGVLIDRDVKTDDLVARAQELSGQKATGPITPAASTTTNSQTARPRRTNQPGGQDVEVKPGTPTDQKTPATTNKDKKSKDKKSGESKVLRNP